MKYLIVVAHPDDEVLGAGASIKKWTAEGSSVDVCIMCTEAKARAFRPSDGELEDDTHKAIKSLGVGRIYEGTFPNIEMNRRQTECNQACLNCRGAKEEKTRSGLVTRVLRNIFEYGNKQITFE